MGPSLAGRALPSTATPQTRPPPSLLLAREECAALPGMLAAAPPLGSEIRTIWRSEGSQDSAWREAAPPWQPQACWGPGGAGGAGRGRRAGEPPPARGL